MEHKDTEPVKVSWRKSGRRTQRRYMHYPKKSKFHKKGDMIPSGMYEDGIKKQKVKPTLYLSKSEILELQEIVWEEQFRSLSGLLTTLIREELKRRKIKVKTDDIVDKELLKEQRKYEKLRKSKKYKKMVKDTAKLLDKIK